MFKLKNLFCLYQIIKKYKIIYSAHNIDSRNFYAICHTSSESNSINIRQRIKYNYTKIEIFFRLRGGNDFKNDNLETFLSVLNELGISSFFQKFHKYTFIILEPLIYLL